MNIILSYYLQIKDLSLINSFIYKSIVNDKKTIDYYFCKDYKLRIANTDTFKHIILQKQIQNLYNIYYIKNSKENIYSVKTFDDKIIIRYKNNKYLIKNKKYKPVILKGYYNKFYNKFYNYKKKYVYYYINVKIFIHYTNYFIDIDTIPNINFNKFYNIL